MSENWDEEDQGTAAVAAEAAAAAVVPELPDIKLFGKWSCEEVNISDMSLQVRTIASLSLSSSTPYDDPKGWHSAVCAVKTKLITHFTDTNSNHTRIPVSRDTVVKNVSVSLPPRTTSL